RSGVAASPQAFPAREFVVSPRICRDRVNVLYSPPAGAGPSCARLTLLSPLGRAVREQTIQSGSWATLDMVRLPAGTYFLRLETPAAVRTQKLVLRD
ncbi:T9SS type A sorting domain-containing protein, partial [candidate division WOR-3 bacterium]|nr:T9SS type A sorting domain-containing protein [candidate division WOR-3 bacterium]